MCVCVCVCVCVCMCDFQERCLSDYTNLPPPWSRVPLEKLIGPETVKKFGFVVTRRLVPTFTRAHHISLL